MSIKSELIKLQQKNGLLRPEDAIEWARSHKDSALYGAIDWNDATAAHSYRLWQVRQLIAVHVVNENNVRRMVSLSIDRVTSGGGYRALDDVMASQSLREVMLTDALAELERIKLKYETLTELAKVWVETEAVKQQQRPRRRRSSRQERPEMRA